ncbi:MAG: mechanosensitive ion channel family protein [Haloarculaceae archaeon]
MLAAQSDGGTATAAPSPTPSAPDIVGTYLPSWVPGELIQVVLAVVVLVVAYYLAGIVRRVLGRRIARRFKRPSVTRTVLRGIQTTVLVLGGIVALQVLGLRLGNLVLSVTVFSAVAGFVLAPIIGSVINGLFILSDQPYEIGDMIYLADEDVYGFVEDITLRYTKLFTLDNTFLVVTNGSIQERDVFNFSAEDTRTRLELDVLVTYESDIPEARRLVEEAAQSVENVISGGPDIRVGSARYPAGPRCYIDSFADHGVNLRLRYWVTEPYKLLTARSQVQTALWERLPDADVEIAYPHSHLFFDDTSGEMRVNLTDGDRPEGLSTDDSRGPPVDETDEPPVGPAEGAPTDGPDGRPPSEGPED